MRLAWTPSSITGAAVAEPDVAAGMLDALSVCADLAERMLSADRAALLLRPQMTDYLEPLGLAAARDRLLETTARVPMGRVRLDRWWIDEDNIATNLPRDTIVVDTIFMHRCAVTNQQYQAFVDEGGYEQRSLWHASVWPRVRSFVDESGKAGPHYWRNGSHERDIAEHPVVGVSWFEADAYARWIGMRLPSDAEWVRSACCPLETGSGLLQRKYPWGDAFDRRNANLWGSGLRQTTPVSDYEPGDSAFGLRQLVGNVWEWTASDVSLWGCGRELELDEPLKSLRGGSFDAYFETQATCQVRSGDNPLARKHNIGFRCAVNACDVNHEVIG